MPKLAFIANKISSGHVGWLRTCLLIGQALALPLASAAPVEWQAVVEWPAGTPCEPEWGHILPSQPTLGLALYRFECPGSPPKLVSATRKADIAFFIASQAIPRGTPPTGTPAGTAKVSRMNDMPLSASALPNVQARRALAPGEPLLARDFEPRRLWIGGEPIMLKITNGNVSASLPATSLGVGRLGEQASAKTETGKLFSGIVTLENAGPILLVGGRGESK